MSEFGNHTAKELQDEVLTLVNEGGRVTVTERQVMEVLAAAAAVTHMWHLEAELTRMVIEAVVGSTDPVNPHAD